MLMEKNKAGNKDKRIQSLEAVLAMLKRAFRRGLAEDVASWQDLKVRECSRQGEEQMQRP